MILIAGSLQASHCLLLTWCILTVFISIKHVWVLITHDWTAVEDWTSVTFLLFISLVFPIVWSRILEIKVEQSTLPAADNQKSLSLSLNKNPAENCPVKTPDCFPRGIQTDSGSGGGRVKLVSSSKMIHCVTEKGLTKCFTRTKRSN